jgi:hypothetical protein
MNGDFVGATRCAWETLHQLSVELTRFALLHAIAHYSIYK